MGKETCRRTDEAGFGAVLAVDFKALVLLAAGVVVLDLAGCALVSDLAAFPVAGKDGFTDFFPASGLDLSLFARYGLFDGLFGRTGRMVALPDLIGATAFDLWAVFFLLRAVLTGGLALSLDWPADLALAFAAAGEVALR